MFYVVKTHNRLNAGIITYMELMHSHSVQEFIHVSIHSDIVRVVNETVLDLGYGIIAKHAEIVRGWYAVDLDVYFSQVGHF